MNKLMTAIFASAFLCLSSFSLVWADGWGNTNWGMNIPQVEEAVKGKLISHRQDIPPKGYSHKLQDNISIGDCKFEVYFNFEGSKLDKVSLDAASSELSKVYLYLKDELQKKYGSPSAGPKLKKESFGFMYTVEWMSKDTVINLVHFFYKFDEKDAVQGTSVHYSSRQSASSDSL